MADVLTRDLLTVKTIYARSDIDPACKATVARLIWWGLNGGVEPASVSTDFSDRARAVFKALRDAVPSRYILPETAFMRLHAAYQDIRNSPDADRGIDDLFEAAING